MRRLSRFTLAPHLLLALALPLALAAPQAAPAAELRWAGDGDAASMDPHSRHESFQLGMLLNVYEALQRRGRDLKLEPALAVSVEAVSDTVWRYVIRDGVHFHDGRRLSREDVIFSLQRAMRPGSNIRGNFTTVLEIRPAGERAVEIVTRQHDPQLPDKMAQIAILSRSWAETNNAAEVADLTKSVENFATRHANGTGPFRLESRDPGIRTVFARHDGWWDKPAHNLDKVTYTRIQNDPSRLAALLSGEIDMNYAVSPQDTARLKQEPRWRLYETPEMRIVFLGLNQQAEQLPKASGVTGNPFKDRRVRQAFTLAIDAEAIGKAVMRGYSQPTRLLVAAGINGHQPDLAKQLASDPAAARQLLKAAGYEAGFGLTLDCPNDRYVMDEEICQAVAAQLARIGIRVTVNARPGSRHFAGILRSSAAITKAPDTGFYLMGLSPAATYDTHNIFQVLLRTPDQATGAGLLNSGGYSNPELDRLIDAVGVERRADERQRMIRRVTETYQQDFAYIPLHQQMVIWATRRGVDLVQSLDNYFAWRFVTVRAK